MTKTSVLVIVLLTILSTAISAQQTVATALLQTDLPDIEGREAVILEVEVCARSGVGECERNLV